MEAYLDNSATTKVCEEAIEKMCRCMRESWGNPSSLHSAGIKASAELEEARKAAASLLGVETKEIFFTSGGTESNNLAIRGASLRNRRNGKKIVTDTIEHSSVIETMNELEKQGFEIVRLSPKDGAKITEEDLESAIDEQTVLVSLMAVNNEVGSVQPFDRVKSIIKMKHSQALLHVDAVQAFGKMPIKPKSMGIDLLTASSHKIHGPKGAGILYINEKAKISPVTFGGEQEKRIRPGTEPVPAIVGFGEAIKQLPNINAQLKKMTELRDAFVSELRETEGVFINSPDDALPYIVNISLDRMRSETVLNFLSSMGIYVSSGSACAKGHKSHVLEALSLDANRIDGAIRVSLSRFTTKEELDYFKEGITKAMKMLRKR